LSQQSLDFGVGSGCSNTEQECRSLRKLSLMLSDALESFIQIFSPPFRKVMWKSLGLTAIVLFLLGLGLDRLASSLMPAAPTWLSWILSIVVAVGLIASLTILAAPTASLVAGFYLDDIADTVEREIVPLGPRGRPLPLPASLYVGLRFGALSLLVNLAILALTLFTGVGFVGFFVLNGYLLGREYFELAAMRHLPFSEAVELRRQRSFNVFIAGIIVAVFVAVPLLNLFTPLFATAFMTRTVKRLA
jgi:CysZ protein